jgi:hypothetical protein
MIAAEALRVLSHRITLPKQVTEQFATAGNVAGKLEANKKMPPNQYVAACQEQRISTAITRLAIGLAVRHLKKCLCAQWKHGTQSTTTKQV